MASSRCVARTMAMLSLAYPRYQMEKQTPQVYADLLSDIPDELLVAAAKQHAASSKWFPSVAELREAAMDIQARAAGILTAEEAWLQVQAAVKQFGWYGEPIAPDNGGGWRVPSMLDKLTQDAIDGLGGWKMLCQSDNEVANRAHFLRIYSGLLQRKQADAAMLPQVRDVVEALRQPQALQLEAR